MFRAGRKLLIMFGLNILLLGVIAIGLFIFVIHKEGSGGSSTTANGYNAPQKSKAQEQQDFQDYKDDVSAYIKQQPTLQAIIGAQNLLDACAGQSGQLMPTYSAFKGCQHKVAVQAKAGTAVQVSKAGYRIIATAEDKQHTVFFDELSFDQGADNQLVCDPPGSGGACEKDGTWKP